MAQVTTIQRAPLAGDEAQYHTFINGALVAIATDFAGASAPTETYAHMNWTDTSTNPATARRRNAANSGWDALTIVFATQAEALAGTNTAKAMNALRVKQAVDQAIAAIPGGTPSLRVFTASGTWNRPSGVTKVLLYVTGGGGGPSTDNNPGANPGWTVIKELDVSDISSATISIGAAGGGATNHYTNTAGSPSTFSGGGSTVSAAGGAGGGSPGSNSNFDLAILNKYPSSYGSEQTPGLIYILEFR